VRVEGDDIEGAGTSVVIVLRELGARWSAVSQIQNFGDLQHLSPQLRHLLGRDVGVGAGDVHL
jgi:hypothetical protein